MDILKEVRLMQENYRRVTKREPNLVIMNDRDYEQELRLFMKNLGLNERPYETLPMYGMKVKRSKDLQQGCVIVTEEI